MTKLIFLMAILVSIVFFLINPYEIIAQLAASNADKRTQNITFLYTFNFEGNRLVSHISSTDPDVNVWDGWFGCIARRIICKNLAKTILITIWMAIMPFPQPT